MYVLVWFGWVGFGFHGLDPRLHFARFDVALLWRGRKNCCIPTIGLPKDIGAGRNAEALVAQLFAHGPRVGPICGTNPF